MIDKLTIWVGNDTMTNMKKMISSNLFQSKLRITMEAIWSRQGQSEKETTYIPLERGDFLMILEREFFMWGRRAELLPLLL